MATAIAIRDTIRTAGRAPIGTPVVVSGVRPGAHAAIVTEDPEVDLGWFDLDVTESATGLRGHLVFDPTRGRRRPTPGRYGAALEVTSGGDVTLTPFVVEVTRNKCLRVRPTTEVSFDPATGTAGVDVELINCGNIDVTTGFELRRCGATLQVSPPSVTVTAGTSELVRFTIAEFGDGLAPCDEPPELQSTCELQLKARLRLRKPGLITSLAASGIARYVLTACVAVVAALAIAAVIDGVLDNLARGPVSGVDETDPGEDPPEEDLPPDAERDQPDDPRPGEEPAGDPSSGTAGEPVGPEDDDQGPGGENGSGGEGDRAPSPEFAVRLEPAELTFASVLGGVTADQHVTVINDGRDIGQLDYAIDSGTAGFALENVSCATTLRGGESCELAVSYSATAGTNAGGILLIFADQSQAGYVSLHGSTLPLLELSHDRLAYETPLGSVSAAQTVTIENRGGPASGVEIDVASDAGFEVVARTCAADIGAGDTCTVSVTHRPAALGASEATLVVRSAGTISEVALVGTGVNAVSAEPTALSFEGLLGVPTAAQRLAVTNTSDEAIEPLFSVTPADVGFTVDHGECAGALAAGAVCTVEVVYTPDVAAPVEAALEVSGPGGPVLVSLIGQGSTATDIDVSPAELQLVVPIGAASTTGEILVTNRGGPAWDLRVTLDPPGAFTIETNYCDPALGSDRECPVVIRFDPIDGVAHDTTVQVWDADVLLRSTLLNGTVEEAAPQLTVDTPEVRFVGFVGDPSPEQKIAVTNRGTGTAEGLAVRLEGDAGEFSLNSDCSGTLVPGATCAVGVVFIASDYADAEATLVVQAPGSEATVWMTGAVFIAPDAALR